MDTLLFAGEEEKAKLASAKYGWRHAFTLRHAADFDGQLALTVAALLCRAS